MKGKIAWMVLAICVLMISYFVYSIVSSHPIAILLSPSPAGNTLANTQPINWRRTTTIYLGKNQFHLLDRLSPQSDGAAKALWAYPNDSLGRTLRRIKLKTDANIGPDSVLFMIKPLKSASYKGIVDAMDQLSKAKVRRYSFEDKLTEADKALLRSFQIL